MLSAWIVSIWLLCLSVSDIRSRNVSAWLVGVGGAIALVVSFVENLPEVAEHEIWLRYAGNVLCGMVPGVCLLLLAVATKTVGSGDGAVLTLLGAVTGFQKTILVLCVGMFLAAFGSIVLLVVKKVNRNTCLPFLPFLAAGWFLNWIK